MEDSERELGDVFLQPIGISLFGDEGVSCVRESIHQLTLEGSCLRAFGPASWSALRADRLVSVGTAWRKSTGLMWVSVVLVAWKRNAPDIAFAAAVATITNN